MDIISIVVHWGKEGCGPPVEEKKSTQRRRVTESYDPLEKKRKKRTWGKKNLSGGSIQEGSKFRPLPGRRTTEGEGEKQTS